MILVSLATSFLELQNSLTNYTLEYVTDTYSDQSKIAYFDNIDTLEKNAKNLRHTPFLTETVDVVYKLRLSYCVTIVDADLNRDGVCKLYTPSLFLDYLVKPWKFKFGIVRIGNLFGDSSKLSFTIASFLNTLPLVVYEPFFVAFVTAILTNNYTIFDNFLLKNRLRTNENIKEWNMFNEYFQTLKEYIPILNVHSKLKKLPSDTRASLYRIKQLVKKYKEFSIESYTDKEDNITK